MSITPGERKAVIFLAALLALGASVRLVSASRDQARAALTPRESAALAAQLAAVDSQRTEQRTSRSKRNARPRRPRAKSAAPTRDGATASESTLVVDVDRASASELEALPRIGPALAKRIVSDRDEYGPFGSLAGLQRVKGIGPKMVMHIAKHVTFSGSARPSSALSVSVGSAPNASRPPPRPRTAR